MLHAPCQGKCEYVSFYTLFYQPFPFSSFSYFSFFLNPSAILLSPLCLSSINFYLYVFSFLSCIPFSLSVGQFVFLSLLYFVTILSSLFSHSHLFYLFPPFPLFRCFILFTYSLSDFSPFPLFFHFLVIYSKFFSQSLYLLSYSFFLCVPSSRFSILY